MSMPVPDPDDTLRLVLRHCLEKGLFPTGSHALRTARWITKAPVPKLCNERRRLAWHHVLTVMTAEQVAALIQA